MFWQLIYKGKISYLLGTCHIVPFERLPKEVQNIVLHAKNFCLETTDPFPQDDLYPFEPNYNEKNGHHFYQQLPKNLKNKLDSILKFYNTQLQRRTHPILPEHLGPRRMLYHLSCCYDDYENGMDLTLQKIATLEKKPIFELDLNDMAGPFERPFSEMTDEQIEPTVQYLSTNFDSLEQCKEDEVQKYIDNFFNPDISQLEEDLPTSQNEYEQCGERNYKWAPEMLDLHLNLPESTVFAGGYAHLYGVHGILNILKCSGFQLKKMSANGTFHSCEIYYPETRNVFQIIAENQALRSLLVQPSAPTERNRMLTLYHAKTEKNLEQFSNKSGTFKPNSDMRKS